MALPACGRFGKGNAWSGSFQITLRAFTRSESPGDLSLLAVNNHLHFYYCSVSSGQLCISSAWIRAFSNLKLLCFDMALLFVYPSSLQASHICITFTSTLTIEISGKLLERMRRIGHDLDTHCYFNAKNT